jgi:adenylate kinase family enzyme
MFAVIVTGAPGAGKSSALTALSGRLADEGVRHVTVEVDDLSRGHPWRDGLRHLGAFAEEEELLLVGATVESADHLVRLLAAIGDPPHFLVRLHARPETLRERIRGRETVPWSGLDALAGRAEALQEAIAALPADLVLDSEAAAPQELARTIRSASSRARSTRSATSGLD